MQNYDWNVMFYGMFFIGIIAIVIGLFWFKLYQSTTNPKADIPGIIYSTIGFGSLLYGFSEAGNKGWGSTEIVTMFIVGTVFIIFFYFKRTKNESANVELGSIKISNLYTYNYYQYDCDDEFIRRNDFTSIIFTKS